VQALGLRVGTSMCDALRYRARLSSRAASAASIGELRRRARSRTSWNRRKAEKMGNGLRKARSSGVTSRDDLLGTVDLDCLGLGVRIATVRLDFSRTPNRAQSRSHHRLHHAFLLWLSTA